MAECLKVIYLSIFLVTVEAPRTKIRDYNNAVPLSIPPTEGPISWFTLGILLPDIEHGLSNVIGLATPYAPYLGLIIAGRSEFPWIVDVSNQDLDEEGHGIGNLISSYWVATAGHIYLEWSWADQCGPSEAYNYQVKFCTNYLEEDWYKYHENFDDEQPFKHLSHGADESGTRLVEKIVRHPLCTRYSREWDLMMIKMNRPIQPVLPEISYIPFNPNHLGQYHIRTITQEFLTPQVCYLATYGRQFTRHPEPVNHRFKTRYRSYPVDWSVCRHHRPALCSIDAHYVDEIAEWFFDQGAEDFGGRQLQCFEMKNYNGAVCQHDQGAPMVCNGIVVGFLVRGVNIQLCRSGSPYPFVVVKLDAFNLDFFSGIPQTGLTRPPTPTTPFILPLDNFTRIRERTVDWQQFAPFWKN